MCGEQRGDGEMLGEGVETVEVAVQLPDEKGKGRGVWYTIFNSTRSQSMNKKYTIMTKQ